MSNWEENKAKNIEIAKFLGFKVEEDMVLDSGGRRYFDGDMAYHMVYDGETVDGDDMTASHQASEEEVWDRITPSFTTDIWAVQRYLFDYFKEKKWYVRIEGPWYYEGYEEPVNGFVCKIYDGPIMSGPDCDCKHCHPTIGFGTSDYLSGAVSEAFLQIMKQK